MSERINFSIESEGSSDAASIAAQTVLDTLRGGGLKVQGYVTRRAIGKFRSQGEIEVPEHPARALDQGVLKAQLEALRESADQTGCDNDLIVVSSGALAAALSAVGLDWSFTIPSDAA